jgi:GNAT superfamily N-acetyltransferase
MTDNIILRDLESGDAGWIIQQHAELYARDEGFDMSFEALVAEIMADFIRRRDPARDRTFIAAKGDERLGCIFCVGKDERTAKLRLFLVVPEARGHGLGHRLIAACMDWAKAQGYGRMELSTHESHEAACALYAAHGWHIVRSEAVKSFGVQLVEQSWEIEF